MSSKKIFTAQRILLRNHPEINEAFIQKAIADNPAILGLGELELIGKERAQIRGGRLDFLFRDANRRRYEIELQLGSVDPSHIIRTIEYWDIERKRYPQHDHCAVIIAEEITGRFHNVINLFNGFIPLIAIQLSAYKFGDEIALIFTKVLDEMPLGLDEEDIKAEGVSRETWVSNTSEEAVKLAEDIQGFLQEINPSIALNFTKMYVGLTLNNIANNFVILRPNKKNSIQVDLRMPETAETDDIINKAGFETVPYDARYKMYRFRLTKADLNSATKQAVLKDLLQQTYEQV